MTRIRRFSIHAAICCALLTASSVAAQFEPIGGAGPGGGSDDVACGGFMAWSQPTQGAVQVSPTFFGAPDNVGDRLAIELGHQLVFNDAPQGPVILEAEIPLVANRATFLIGATPIPDPAHLSGERENIAFEVWSRSGTGRTQATLHTKIKDAGGNVLYQYNPSRTTAGQIRWAYFPTNVGGPCTEQDLRVDEFIEFPVEDQSVALNSYRFPGGPGAYSYETEVRQYDPSKHNGWGAPLGYKVVVKVQVVNTRMPRTVVYPVLDPKQVPPSGASADQRRKDLWYRGLEAVGYARKKIQSAFPLPHQEAFRQLHISGATLDLSVIGNPSRHAIRQRAQLAGALGKIDKAIYYMEEPLFRANYLSEWLGATQSKEFASVKSQPLGLTWDIIGEYQRRRRSEADTIAHELAHMSRRGTWADAEMAADCNLNYHNQFAGVSYGVQVIDDQGLPDDLKRVDFLDAATDIMAHGLAPAGQEVNHFSNQCTWWNILTEWSKPRIDPELVIVSGAVEKGLLQAPKGSLAPIYHRTGDIKAPEAPGSYRIELRDFFGSLLEEYRFDVNFKQAEAPFAGFDGSFVYALEAPAGLSEIRLYDGANLLDSRRLSSSAPVIGDSLVLTRQAVDPQWIEYVATWSATDRDFLSSLVHTLLYSDDDGETYMETGIFQQSSTSATIRIPRSATHLQVWTGDGGRSDHAEFAVNPFCEFLSSCSLSRL
ncbi:hypothetical protein ABI59_10660 [Acidobacteria bacterium Mor1]|nr:hypothetical protein ABI59_10660 [Acidobacteria bacterium Mor1]